MVGVRRKLWDLRLVEGLPILLEFSIHSERGRQESILVDLHPLVVRCSSVGDRVVVAAAVGGGGTTKPRSAVAVVLPF